MHFPHPREVLFKHSAEELWDPATLPLIRLAHPFDQSEFYNFNFGLNFKTSISVKSEKCSISEKNNTPTICNKVYWEIRGLRCKEKRYIKNTAADFRGPRACIYIQTQLS